MRLKVLASALVTLLVTASALTVMQNPASASMHPGSDSAKRQPVGFIVTYKKGVELVAPDGNPTGENFAGVELANPHDIGLGMTAVSFAGSIDATAAETALENLKRDPRVDTAQIDYTLDLSSQSIRNAAIVPSKPRTAIKMPAAPSKLVVTNDFLSSTPRTARVKLSWAAPKTLNGGKLTGYLVEYSINGGAWTGVAVKGSSRKLSITSGLATGLSTSFRVKASVLNGKKSLTSSASTSVKFTPTTAPAAPQFIGSNVVFSGQAATWAPSSASSRGGLPVTYQVRATSTAGSVVTCTTISNSCTPAGMTSGVGYTVKVTATNSLGSATSMYVDDKLYPSQWHLYSAFGIQAPVAWQTTTGSNSIVVAVLDSGITSHPDLNAKVLPGYDFVSDATAGNDNQSAGIYGSWDDDASDPGDWGGGYTSSWHGTHVAGIIAAQQNDGYGVSGVAPNVKILPVRILGSNSNTYKVGDSIADLIAGINWAAGVEVANVPLNPNPARVINLSLGTAEVSGCDAATQAAFRAAWDRGITAVTAAGNMGFEAVGSYPGNCYPTINVGATGITGDMSYYSNYGPGVDISAPGGDESLASVSPDGTDGMILSTWNKGETTPGAADWSIEEGTSMAAPVVAGVVALIYSVNPKLGSEDAYEIMKKTVKAFKSGTRCAETAPQYAIDGGYSYCGAGIVNAGAAVQLAKTYKPK